MSASSRRQASARSAPITSRNMRIAERTRRSPMRAWWTNSGSVPPSSPSSLACSCSRPARTTLAAAAAGVIDGSSATGRAFCGRRDVPVKRK